MNHQLLESVIQLLLIIAREDNVISESEKEAIYDFIFENVGPVEIDKYTPLIEQGVGDEDEEVLIGRITHQINRELDKAQKFSILVYSMEIIMADNVITSRERELMTIICSDLYFDLNILYQLKIFLRSSFDERFITNKNFLFLDINNPVLERSNIKKIHQENDNIIIFHPPQIDLLYFKYHGKHILKVNGNDVQEEKITILPKGGVIKIENSKRIFYGEVINAFLRSKDHNTVSFVAENLSYLFSNKQVALQNININEPKGVLFAIMGGSGTGKSTLLRVLNGNNTPSSGSVKINGIDIHKESEKIHGVIGYVPQNDLLIEDLTVFENLYYSAKLCAAHLKKKELISLVNRTLDALEIRETEDMKVGNEFSKTISGGQRKRLNIGLELLRQPSVLFVDEPTSGLSSNDSVNAMELLKELSLKGKMIFVVIHQPSSDIFKMLDKLLILDTGGRQIYYGNPISSVRYFKKAIKKAGNTREMCPECGNVYPEEIFNIIEKKIVDEYGKITSKRKYSSILWEKYFQKKFASEQESQQAPQKQIEHPKSDLSIPNRIKQVLILLQRDVKAKLSNHQYILINLLEAPLLALILSLVVKQVAVPEEGYTFYDNENIPIFFFISVIVSLFLGLSVSAEEIIKDRKILKREAFLHLSKSSYLTSKTIVLFSISALQSLLFLLIGCAILEIREMFFMYWLVLFSVSCSANILGLNISSALNSAVAVYIIIPILIIPQMLLSGVVVSFDKLNPLFLNKEKVPIVGEVMTTRWAYEALMVNQFVNNPYNQEFYEIEKKVNTYSYKYIYHVKTMIQILNFCKKNMGNPIIKSKLNLLRTEITKEINNEGAVFFSHLDKLNLKDFNVDIYNSAKEYLLNLHTQYKKKKEKHKNILDKKKEELSQDPSFDIQKKKKLYENSSVSRVVKGVFGRDKIMILDDKLVQNLYPVYSKKTALESPLDFRTRFYYAEKHFWGMYIPTPVFNIIVIWIITLFFYITLYFDVFKKMVYFISKLF